MVKGKIIMELASLILTTIFGTASIVISIYCWRHAYNEIKITKEIIKNIHSIDFSQEGTFTLLENNFRKANENGIDISKQFNKKEKHVPKDKATKNQMISAMYNLHQNLKGNNNNETL